MPFTIDRWRTELGLVVADIMRDPQGACQRANAPDLYALLLGSTMLPIIAAYQDSPNGVICALVSVAGSFGMNLIANVLQHKYAAHNLLAITTGEAQSQELAEAYAKIAHGLQLLPIAEAALQQHPELAAHLRAEHLRRAAAPAQFALALGAPHST